ncbi:MAG: TonB-dependent receptor [Flavobacteriales bacterium]
MNKNQAFSSIIYQFTFTILLLFFLCSSAFAQIGKTINGEVRNDQLVPLQGVFVVNMNSGSSATSNGAGSFNLDQTQNGDSIRMHLFGFRTLTLLVEDTDALFSAVLKPIAVSIEEIEIAPSIDAIQLVTKVSLKTNPVRSSQEILRQVPGLFIGQHAGGGKAEQLFLRGFDIDHGTDISISVDGLPVNMVSHAHGQGYSDLHFVIPETVENIDFGKGPYNANRGNFTTAGYVEFQTKDHVENNLVKIETGMFNTHRVLALLELYKTKKSSSYIAGEHLVSDGAFESPQNFRRTNLLGKFHHHLNSKNLLSLSVSHFDSKWSASGQVPERAIESGLITRFGAIDATEGGETTRTNAQIKHEKLIDDRSVWKTQAFVSNYDFTLFSNFTFFLNDPINGDQIKQHENRTIYGLLSDYVRTMDWGNWDVQLKAGINARHDYSRNNELSRTLRKELVLSRIQLGDINETNVGSYVDFHLTKGKWVLNPSVRWDVFNFHYKNALENDTILQTAEQIVSPRLNVLYNPTQKIQLYIKAGKGFHSNDTRVVLANNDTDILPSAYGVDIGSVFKVKSKFLVNVAYWYLFSEQEFVYVGDEGIVEPSGRSNREGIDLSLRYQILDWLFWNADVNYTKARTEGDVEDEFIPLAPQLTSTSGLSVKHPSGFFAGLQARHLSDRPANGDNSIVAEGYTIVDLNAGMEFNKLQIGVNVQNLFNTSWKETQFATTSRLQSETEAVEEIHFTPGAPFFIQGSIAYKF